MAKEVVLTLFEVSRTTCTNVDCQISTTVVWSKEKDFICCFFTISVCTAVVLGNVVMIMTWTVRRWLVNGSWNRVELQGAMHG